MKYKKLPPPLANSKTGFPWTVSEIPTYSNTDLPRISVVIPSYQQGQFIEETLRSILLQNYPNLELIVVDGGSTDNTVSILEYYDDWIDNWVSEKDNGQSHAINKGLKKATGDWLAFMNSDDGYLEGTFWKIFAQPFETDLIYGTKGYVGKTRATSNLRTSEYLQPLRVENLLRFFKDLNYIIPSQSVFFSRQLFERVGYFDETLHFGMDVDWYVRAALLNPNCVVTEFPSYFFRIDDHSKTANYHWKGFYEIVGIAQKYMLHLKPKVQQQLRQEIAYNEILRKVDAAKQTPDWATLKEWFLANPKEAVKDRFYWGMVRKKLF